MFLDLLKKYRVEIIVAFLLIIFFLLFRLVKLTALPIFVDEAIYLRWAQIAKNDANWRFISLTDGKQPLYVWVTMVMMRFIQDPIAAGRLVSTFAGLVSMAAIWVLTYLLFKNRRVAFLASFLYLVSPFALVYDRMALMDTMVGAFSVLSFFLAVLLVKTLRLDVALILGAVLGGGVLTKTSGFLSIYLLPSTLLLFDWSAKKRRINLMRWLALVLLAVLISQFFYNILRLSPFFHIIAQKNTLFVFPFEEWIKHPFYYLKSHLSGLSNWLLTYLTWPLVLLVLFSLLNLRDKFREKLLLFGWFAIPFVGLAVFGNILYPRFIFSMSLYLFVLAALSLEEIAKRLKNKLIFVAVLILATAMSLSVDLKLLLNPQTAPIAISDRDQYILSWPAGYGIKEIAAFADEKAKDGKIFIATEGTFGLMPASLELYLWDNPKVEIKGFFPVEKIPVEVLEKAKIMPTYFVFNETLEVPGSWPLKLVQKYPRPNPRYSMRFYQVIPPVVQ